MIVICRYFYYIVLPPLYQSSTVFFKRLSSFLILHPLYLYSELFFSKDYIHFYSGPRLSDDNIPLKLTGGIVISNFSKSEMPSLNCLSEWEGFKLDELLPFLCLWFLNSLIYFKNKILFIFQIYVYDIDGLYMKTFATTGWWMSARGHSVIGLARDYTILSQEKNSTSLNSWNLLA